MRTLAWNCRGLGIDSTVRRLKEINRKYLLDIICLSETKQQDDYIRDIGAQLGLFPSVIVTPQGTGGGLVIFTRQHVHLSVLCQSSNLIDCNVQLNGFQFNYSFVYGHPNPSLRHYTWEKLERLSLNRRNQPWFIRGDFNEILGNHEKSGGRIRPEVSFQNFRQMIRVCDFTDIKTVGDSDHRPLVTFISAEQEVPRRFFRFDSRMVSKEGFQESVKRGWKGMGQTQLLQIPLVHRLSRCRKEISVWKQHNRNNAAEKIELFRRQLDQAVVSPSSTTQEQNEIKNNLQQAYLEEEIYWKQKSRVMWLRSGDRNTSYFHAVTKAKRIRNTLSTIQDDNGVVHRGQKEISNVATTYFHKLYRSSPTDQCLYDSIFQGFGKRVTDAMNQDLVRQVTEDEVRDAIFDMGPNRAPGPDGFSAAFYQRFWEDIKEELMQEVSSFFDGDGLDTAHNHTNLCLIPKVYPPTGMTEFRPIALCNVSYKVFSKILVNRLKQHLGSIISENQNAFIPGRVITDNIVIAHEVFHSLKARKRQATSYMAVKTDITKAYDRLEWKFLEKTMSYMGFDSKWIRWIMTCISTVTFSVLINGTPEGHIIPERGIRQGDPLSSYLFILCAEVLSHMMNKAMDDRSLLGIKIAVQAPSVNHLLFADDSLFFSLANVKAAKKLKKIFTEYESISGQAINLTKSSITFGAKVWSEVKTQMRNVLVTQGWKQRHLSLGGKEIMLKAVAQAMPIYSMGVFRLPKEICDAISNILAQFWWGNGDKKGLHWYAWKRVCIPKREGGLGFKDIELFNQALLGKQIWRILQHPSCLMARILKARYFPDCCILEAGPKKKASHGWKLILYGKELIKVGMRYVVGDGSLIITWIDPWLPVHPPRPPRAIGDVDLSSKVSQLILTAGNNWDEAKLRDLIVDEDVNIIMKIKLSSVAEQDLLGWHYNENGIYSVKSGILQYANDDAKEWQSVDRSQTGNYQQIRPAERQYNNSWRRPPSGRVNCNVDGSFVNNNLEAKVGFIIRGEHGHYREAVQAVGKKVQTAFERKLHFGAYNWIREIRWWMRKFDDITITWVPRKANQVADTLAKAPIPNNSLFIFYFYVPRVITLSENEWNEASSKANVIAAQIELLDEIIKADGKFDFMAELEKLKLEHMEAEGMLGDVKVIVPDWFKLEEKWMLDE
ncbi:uncharacterized protein LOC108816806 [Raphanus sativus]|uniref:Uncharacterized protein LOC108816806 n=1 Tax=Raphanus sativus TaxID=3726 RepID=A0A9W3C7F5_RAPSA|nr:uncharacterized protein LOC108816806 [Raphanus sativus]